MFGIDCGPSVAAPLSTIAPHCPTGTEIPIEERSALEVTDIGSTRMAPEGINVRHSAFDVTPARLITAIITERGGASGAVRGCDSRVVRILSEAKDQVSTIVERETGAVGSGHVGAHLILRFAQDKLREWKPSSVSSPPSGSEARSS